MHPALVIANRCRSRGACRHFTKAVDERKESLADPEDHTTGEAGQCRCSKNMNTVAKKIAAR
jgi:hypothetical protein